MLVFRVYDAKLYTNIKEVDILFGQNFDGDIRINFHLATLNPSPKSF